jgi:hypothetical protein
MFALMAFLFNLWTLYAIQQQDSSPSSTQPPRPTTQKLCTITFDHDRRCPARVDNDAKGCLDDVALNVHRNNDAKLVVVGNYIDETKDNNYVAGKGSRRVDLAAPRALNAKLYLVREKGITPERIELRVGNTGTNEVDDYLVPAGASFDADIQGTKPITERLYRVRCMYPEDDNMGYEPK